MHRAVGRGTFRAARHLREAEPRDPAPRIDRGRFAIRPQRCLAVTDPGCGVAEDDLRLRRPEEQAVRQAPMLARRSPVPPRQCVATSEQRLVTDETPDRQDAQKYAY